MVIRKSIRAKYECLICGNTVFKNYKNRHHNKTDMIKKCKHCGSTKIRNTRENRKKGFNRYGEMIL